MIKAVRFLPSSDPTTDGKLVESWNVDVMLGVIAASQVELGTTLDSTMSTHTPKDIQNIFYAVDSNTVTATTYQGLLKKHWKRMYIQIPFDLLLRKGVVATLWLPLVAQLTSQFGCIAWNEREPGIRLRSVLVSLCMCFCTAQKTCLCMCFCTAHETCMCM